MKRVTVLVGVMLGAAALLASSVLVLALRLPSTAAYGLPDDVPPYPRGTLSDTLVERASAAWG